MHPFFLFALCALNGALVDVLSKRALISWYGPSFSFPVCSGLALSSAWNQGVSFSVLSWNGTRWFLVGASCVLTVWIGWQGVRSPSRWVFFGACLIVAGAVGNIVDRVQFGAVFDFFETTWFAFPIFNVADVEIVLGTFFWLCAPSLKKTVT